MFTISVTAKRIRLLREALQLSRPKFSALFDMPYTTLKNYEMGYREVGGSFLIAIGKVLGADALLWIMELDCTWSVTYHKGEAAAAERLARLITILGK